MTFRPSAIPIAALCFAALCIALGNEPALADDAPFVLLPDKSLLSADAQALVSGDSEAQPLESPDRDAPSLVSLDPDAELKTPGRDWIGLGRDTLLLFGYQLVGIGVLYAMPEETTGWTEEKKKASFANWWDNVRNPYWDSDTWYVNYIGHTYFGAAYFIRARERGFSWPESFVYSALASAMYEFGVEAVFEQPSIQDLIVTPVGGALLGLALEPLRNWVKRQPEPRWYGHVILIATDPIGTLNYVFERLVGIKSDIRVDVGHESKFRVELRMRFD